MVKEMIIKIGYKQTELGLIPKDWDVKKLGEIGEIKMCRRIFSHETKEDGIIPFYKIGTFGKVADAYISQEIYFDYKRRFSYPQKGDILISAAGTIGRTVIFDGTPSYFQDSNIVWLHNNEQLISNHYLYYIFQIVKYNTEGGTIQRLYNSILNNTKFICPTKSEQTAIATVLSDTDSLIDNLDKLITKKKAIKQGTMQQLLTGKKRLPGFSGKWEEKKLVEMADFFKGRGLSKSKINQVGLYPCILYGELFTTYSQMIDEVKSKTNSKEGLVSMIGDILLPGSTTTIGIDLATASAIHKKDVLIGGDVIVIRKKLQEYYDSDFLANYLTHVSKYKIAEITQGITIIHLHGSRLQEITVNIPKDVIEQNAIARVISDMNLEIEKLEENQDKYVMIKDGMMQQLLTGKIRIV